MRTHMCECAHTRMYVTVHNRHRNYWYLNPGGSASPRQMTAPEIGGNCLDDHHMAAVTLSLPVGYPKLAALGNLRLGPQ